MSNHTWGLNLKMNTYVCVYHIIRATRAHCYFFSPPAGKWLGKNKCCHLKAPHPPCETIFFGPLMQNHCMKYKYLSLSWLPPPIPTTSTCGEFFNRESWSWSEYCDRHGHHSSEVNDDMVGFIIPFRLRAWWTQCTPGTLERRKNRKERGEK